VIDVPTLDELLGDTTDPPPPVRAILCVVGSPSDDNEGRLELRPWPDASLLRENPEVGAYNQTIMRRVALRGTNVERLAGPRIFPLPS